MIVQTHGLREKTTQVKEAIKKLVKTVQEFLDLEGQHSKDSIETVMSEGGSVKNKAEIIRLNTEINMALKQIEDKRWQLKRITQEKYVKNE